VRAIPMMAPMMVTHMGISTERAMRYKLRIS
jgi:hypothetical protein